MLTRDDVPNPSKRDYGDHSEFGGGRGRNLRSPDGMPRRLAVREEAQDMRSEGIRNSAPVVRMTRPASRQ